MYGRVAEMYGRVAEMYGRVAEMYGRVAEMYGRVAEMYGGRDVRSCGRVAEMYGCLAVPGGGENFFVELYGEGSRCVRHAAPWHLYRCGTVSVLQHGGSGCYGVSGASTVGLLLPPKSNTDTTVWVGQYIQHM